jgi:hypothetical protein
MARYNAVNTRAEEVASKPFQKYGTEASDFVAQINQQQQTGINNVNAAAGSYQPYIDAATGATVAGMDEANAAELDINKYMSPYVQNVADTTGAMLSQENARAQSGNLGTAISSGAFGGDRAGIAAANLSQQQNLAYGKTMADIYNQGYTQAVGTAQQQQGVNLGAEQANLARLTAGGAQLAGLGTTAQQAGLAGAEAQINAGTLQQQTEQAGKTALVNQFMQEQGYPFQVAQFLANIATGTGALSGSTTATTQPAPFFSDRRLKHDVKRIGKTDDGLPIYSFKYKGDEKEQTHVGFMADEVEKVKPEAVGVHPTGYKTVDYEKATENSMGGGVPPQRAGEAFADGGVAGPYGSAVGSQPGGGSYVPPAYLPVGELMVADPAHAKNAQGSMAQQLAALASLGESAKELKGTWDWAKDGFKSEAVGEAETARGVAPHAYGGAVAAQYLKPQMGGVAPNTEKSYLTDTLASQDKSDKPKLDAAPGAGGGGSSPAGDIAALAKVGLAIAGIPLPFRNGGAAGYERGGAPDEDFIRGPGLAAAMAERSMPQAARERFNAAPSGLADAEIIRGPGARATEADIVRAPATAPREEDFIRGQGLAAASAERNMPQVAQDRFNAAPPVDIRPSAPNGGGSDRMPVFEPSAAEKYLADRRAAEMAGQAASALGNSPAGGLVPAAGTPLQPTLPAQAAGTPTPMAGLAQAAGTPFPPAEMGLASSPRPVARPEEAGLARARTPGGWNDFAPEVIARESGGDFDALYGFSNREGGPFEGVKVTDMTVDQAIDFSRPDGEYAQWVAPRNDGEIATPMGGIQIVGATLRDVKEGMGLTGDEVMTPELQMKMGEWLYNNRGGEKPWAASAGKGPAGDGKYVGLGLSTKGQGEPQQGGLGRAMLTPDKPYEDRNMMGKIFYNTDGSLNRDAIMSGIGGIGAMLSSPSQFFLPSLGLGLQGFTGTYAGLEQQRGDITAKNLENANVFMTQYLRAQAQGFGGTPEEYAKQIGYKGPKPDGIEFTPTTGQGGGSRVTSFGGVALDPFGRGLNAKTTITVDGQPVEVMAGQTYGYLDALRKKLAADVALGVARPETLQQVEEALANHNGQISLPGGGTVTDPTYEEAAFGASATVRDVKKTEELAVSIPETMRSAQDSQRNTQELAKALAMLPSTGDLSSSFALIGRIGQQLGFDVPTEAAEGYDIAAKIVAGGARDAVNSLAGRVDTNTLSNLTQATTANSNMAPGAIEEILAIQSGIADYNLAMASSLYEAQTNDPNVNLAEVERNFVRNNNPEAFIEKRRPEFKGTIKRPAEIAAGGGTEGGGVAELSTSVDADGNPIRYENGKWVLIPQTQ